MTDSFTRNDMPDPARGAGYSGEPYDGRSYGGDPYGGNAQDTARYGERQHDRRPPYAGEPRGGGGTPYGGQNDATDPHGQIRGDAYGQTLGDAGRTREVDAYTGPPTGANTYGERRYDGDAYGDDPYTVDPYTGRRGAGDETRQVPPVGPRREAEDARPAGGRAAARAARNGNGGGGLRDDKKRQLILGGVAAAVVVAIVAVVLTTGGGGGGSKKASATLAPDTRSTVDAAASAAAGTQTPTTKPSASANVAAPNGPWILLVSGKPIDGQSLSGNVTVTLGPGTETLAGVERVRFTLDGDALGSELRKAPFTATLPRLTPGKHKLSARVRLSAGTKKVEARFTGGGSGGSAAAAAPNTSALPAATPVNVPAAPPPLRTVRVSSAGQLNSALAGARPGDLIQLADGTYAGKFVGKTPASSGAPITVRGSRNAVLDGGSVGSGYVFHLDNGDHWRLEGFTVQDGQKGVMADQTTGAVIANLMVRDIGQEGIHLRNFSTDNFVAGNTVSGTGQKSAGFGEGIYIGSAQSNWAKFSGGQPDKSDRNQIIGNTVYGTTAENVDIKEATTGGVLRGNHFDGATISGANSADSWVDVKGNGWLIQGNTGINSPKDGIQTHVLLDGWGTGNTITGNNLDVRGPGYGVAIDKASRTNNVVGCSNVVQDAASGKFNVACR